MSPLASKQWKVTRVDKAFDGLESEEVSVPRLGENEVLVRIRAVALNFRDLMIPKVYFTTLQVVELWAIQLMNLFFRAITPSL